MSSQLAIPGRVALQQSPPPFRQPSSECLTMATLATIRQRTATRPLLNCLRVGVHSSGLSPFSTAIRAPDVTLRAQVPKYGSPVELPQAARRGPSIRAFAPPRQPTAPRNSQPIPSARARTAPGISRRRDWPPPEYLPALSDNRR